MSVNVKLYCGDNRVSLRRLIDEGVRVHSVVTDPPYGLVSVQKRFGKVSADDGTKTSERIRSRSDGFGRVAAGGFMGKVWDGTGIERDPEFWRLIWEILLPGGYCFAFSGSRTGHWQACAMEQAGFIMHPMHGWVNGQGFPKAHDAAMAIDKTFGASHRAKSFNMKGKEGNPRADEFAANGREILLPWKAESPEAAQWEGWAYGTQAQKPALEPIYLGQKPFSEKTGAANLLKHGVGAVNIDGCRVPGEPPKPCKGTGWAAQDKKNAEQGYRPAAYYADQDGVDYQPNTAGRHPANLILDGSPEVVAMFPASNSARANGNPNNPKRGKNHEATSYGQGDDTVTHDYRDSGSAARFFHQFPPDTDPVIYQSKAGKEDRAGSKHPTVKPVALMQYLIRHITPPGGTVLDPFAGSGTTAEAAKREGFDCILMEAEDEYVEFLRHRFTGDFFCNVEVHDASRGA